MITYPEAYIRVAIVSQRDGMVTCLPVNQQHEAFDGAGFMPGHLKVHEDSIVPAPLARQVENIQLMYGGKKLNRVKRAKETA